MIDVDVLEEIRKEFSKQRFREMYGIVTTGNKQKFISLPNRSLEKNCFVMDSRLWMIRSKIACVAHSHVFSDAYPSDKDREIMRAFGRPFLIYSCLFDNFLYLDDEKCKPI